MDLDVLSHSIDNDHIHNDNTESTSSVLSRTCAYVSTDYADLSINAKTTVVHTLVKRPGFNVHDLSKLATLHNGIGVYREKGKKKNTMQLRSDFLAHSCTINYLVCHDHALIAGLTAPVLSGHLFFCNLLSL
jgi:hypothetical protein